jgi:hypothetical protein
MKTLFCGKQICILEKMLKAIEFPPNLLVLRLSAQRSEICLVISLKGLTGLRRESGKLCLHIPSLHCRMFRKTHIQVFPLISPEEKFR